MARKKALIIGINYYNKSCQLSGCINDATNVRDFLVNERGFVEDAESMVVMTDAPENEGSLLYPNYVNMMNAFQWLVSDNEAGDLLWLSYSGHGGQTTDTNGERPAGYDDTICPADFDTAGQINSTTLHQTLVSPLNGQARLTILFDCCHSGSACELPYVYRPDEEGNVVSVADALKQGAQLVSAVQSLADGPFSVDTLRDANALLHGFTGFAKDLVVVAETAMGTAPDGGPDEDGLVRADTEWASETKDVWMFSGCADDQTSADTKIGGVATGAMSWALIAAMRQLEEPSYIDILTSTRQLLKENYSQIPQLSCGGEYDLDQKIVL